MSGQYSARNSERSVCETNPSEASRPSMSASMNPPTALVSRANDPADSTSSSRTTANGRRPCPGW
jgi:hypothetical protein